MVNQPEDSTPSRQSPVPSQPGGGSAPSGVCSLPEFFVGAALLCSDGSIHRGCNVENASYGLTQCAERVAIANAITAGQRHFVALALSLTKAGTPCGACLQVMQEFAPQLRIILGDETGKWVRETSLPDLLPQPFGFVK
ncbi:MAG: cytidine deaminase [Verrucomicrobiales bacterium]